MADTPFVARKGLVSLGDITGSGHLQLSTVDGLTTATEALFLDSTNTVVSRSLGDSAFQDTGSMTVFNADTATTASHATEVNIGTLTTAGAKDILYTGNDSRVSQDVSGDFTYDPDSNLLSVEDIATGKIVVTQTSDVHAIEILNANARWKQYIDGSGNITLNASGSGNNTNVNYTLEKGHFQLNLKNTAKDFRIRDSGNVTYFVVTGDKKVGIGEAVGISPNQDVDIAGTVRIRDYGSGTKTGTLAYTLGVSSSGDIVEYIGGTDTNIANTDLTATADRTLDMQTNKLTVSASQYFIDTNQGIFEVDTRNGDFRVKSDTSHNVYIEGLPNTETPNIVGYNTSTGRLSYYSTGSFTVYTPNVFSATTKSNVTTATEGPEFSTTDNIGGNSGASIDTTNAYELHLAANTIYEITYSIKAKSTTSDNSGRASVGFFARPFNTSGGGGSDIPGSTSIMYYRNPAYGHTNTHNCTFYYDTGDFTNFEHIRLYLEVAYGTGDVNILSGTISARRIS